MYSYIIPVLLGIFSIVFFWKAYTLKQKNHEFYRLLIWGILFLSYSIIGYFNYINLYIFTFLAIIFFFANYINDKYKK